MGHSRPRDGTGRQAAQVVLEHLEGKYKTDLTNLKKVMTDGTSGMTGCNTGTVAVVKRRLGRPLQRSGCMFHHLEKPYEHLHDHYDGSTTGPQTYSGPHGKAIEEDVWKEEPVDFEPVPNPELLEQIRNIPDDVRKNMSRDTKYGLEIAEVVMTGKLNR